MALAIDGSSPAVATGTGTATTASFTPPDGALLLIGFSGDSNTGANPSSPSITDNLGGHLTYTLWDWHSQADTGPSSIFGQSAMWTAVVGTGAAMTVSVTNNTAGPGNSAAVKVWVITGADTTTPVGAHGKAASASASSISQSYTASATSGQGFLAVCDWDLVGAETAGTGTTVDASAAVGTHYDYAFARRTTDDDSLGVSNTLNVTLPSTSTNLSWCYAEILPAAVNQNLIDPPPFQLFFPFGPAGQFAPNGIPVPWLGVPDAPAQPFVLTVTATQGANSAPGMGLTVKAVRGAAAVQNGQKNSTSTITTPSLSITPNASGSWVYGAMVDWSSSTTWTANGNTTYSLNFSDGTHGDCYATYRSTNVTTASSAVTLGATAPTAQTGNLAQAEILSAGGLVEDPSSPPAVATSSSATSISTAQFYPPPGSLLVAMVASDGGAGSVGMTVSGGGLTWTQVVSSTAANAGYAGIWTARVPGVELTYPLGAVRRRQATPPMRTGRRVGGPIPDQVIITPPVYPVPPVHRLRQVLGRLRGQVEIAAPPQAVVVAPTYVPQPHPARRVAAGQVRRRVFGPLLDQPGPVPAAARRVRVLFARIRGHAAAPAPVQASPPPTQRARRFPALFRRGRGATPVLAQVVLAPPAYVPAAVHRVRQVLGRVRGRAVGIIPAQVVIPPPAYPPAPVHRLRMVLGRLRGRPTMPVQPQQAVPVAPYVPQPHPSHRGIAPGRRVRASTPPTAAPVPQPVARPRRSALGISRRRRATPVPAQIIITPPARVPQPLHKRLWALVTRRRPQAIPPEVCDCVTDRPDTGTASRSNTGTTAYATTMTARPDGGTTARPDTGITEDPCC